MRRHEFDVTSFAGGLVALAIGLGVFVHETTGVSIPLAWLLPVALIGGGIAGVIRVLAAADDESTPEPAE